MLLLVSGAGLRLSCFVCIVIQCLTLEQPYPAAERDAGECDTNLVSNRLGAAASFLERGDDRWVEAPFVHGCNVV